MYDIQYGLSFANLSDLVKTFPFFYFAQTENPAFKRPKANPHVFFDIKIAGKLVGRIVMLLRKDITPKTAGKERDRKDIAW